MFLRDGGDISPRTKPPTAPLSYGASQTNRIAHMRPPRHPRHPRRPQGCAIAATPRVLRDGGGGWANGAEIFVGTTVGDALNVEQFKYYAAQDRAQ